MPKPTLARLSLAIFLLLALSACGVLGGTPKTSPAGNTPAPATAAASPAVPAATATETPASEVGEPPVGASPTPLPTENARPTAAPSDTPPPAQTPWPYQVQPGTPRRMANLFHAGGGCDWMGVGGQILGLNGAPVQDFIVVEVTGRIAGLPVDEMTVAGMAPDYGSAGFEITLANQPLGSTGALQIRLYDRDLNPLSAPVPFDTAPNCDENLVLVNFTANPASFPTPTPSPSPTPPPAARLYLPIIMR